MKYILTGTFMCLLLISSCTCNDNTKTEDETVIVDSMNNADANNTTAESNMQNSDMNDEQFWSLFTKNNYTEEEVREFRRLHDEMDWGGVPGYYPEGSTRELNESDTKYLTMWGHKVMLNEIYARHGKRFTDEDLKEHFNSFGWYQPSADNVQAQLTDIEKQNITFLNNHPATAL